MKKVFRPLADNSFKAEWEMKRLLLLLSRLSRGQCHSRLSARRWKASSRFPRKQRGCFFTLQQRFFFFFLCRRSIRELPHKTECVSVVISSEHHHPMKGLPVVVKDQISRHVFHPVTLHNMMYKGWICCIMSPRQPILWCESFSGTWDRSCFRERTHLYTCTRL